VGVTPEYVRDMRATGLEFQNAGELQSLRALGVTPRSSGGSCRRDTTS